MLGCNDVAQALVPAASALLPTFRLDTLSPRRTGVETSRLDTAGTSACATSAGGVREMQVNRLLKRQSLGRRQLESDFNGFGRGELAPILH